MPHHQFPRHRQHHQRVLAKCHVQQPRNPVVKVVLIFICGSFWRSFWLHHKLMVRQFVGWIGIRPCSKLKIPFVWLVCGDDVKIVQPWITTNCHDRFVNTTRRVSWRRRNDHNGSSINFVIHIVCKQSESSLKVVWVQVWMDSVWFPVGLNVERLSFGWMRHPPSYTTPITTTPKHMHLAQKGSVECDTPPLPPSSPPLMHIPRRKNGKIASRNERKKIIMWRHKKVEKKPGR